MKRLLSLLLVTLLLCTPVFAACAAEQVQDVLTSPGSHYGELVVEGDYFTLHIHSTNSSMVSCDGDGPYLTYTGITAEMYATIEAKAGYVIDEVIFEVSYYINGNDIRFSSGTPSSISGSEYWQDKTIDVKNINSSSLKISRGSYNGSFNYLQTQSIRVIGHKTVPVPATGDAAAPALWLILGLASAGAIVVLTARRRREF